MTTILALPPKDKNLKCSFIGAVKNATFTFQAAEDYSNFISPYYQTNSNIIT
jgi:hypothetical protein